MKLDALPTDLAYLYLPNHLITEEPWRTCLMTGRYNFYKVQTPSENGIKVYLSSSDIEDLVPSLALKSSKQALTLKKSHTSLTPEG